MEGTVSKTYLIEDYLQREEAADFKSEYINGNIVPMTGGTTNHNQIVVNIITELSFAFKKLDDRVYVENVRLWIAEKRIFTYPDIMIIKGKPIYFENRKDTIVNPSLIIKVLSPSTQNYDKEGKFSAYRTIKNFQEYVLISQTRIYGEKFVRTEDKKWLFQEYYQEDQKINLELNNISLNFSDIYQKVDLTS